MRIYDARQASTASRLAALTKWFKVHPCAPAGPRPEHVQIGYSLPNGDQYDFADLLEAMTTYIWELEGRIVALEKMHK